jgi:hypothetical protein
MGNTDRETSIARCAAPAGLGGIVNRWQSQLYVVVAVVILLVAAALAAHMTGLGWTWDES